MQHRPVIIEPALVSRYGSPSLSYACYPEAAHFDRRVGDAAYRACAQRTNEDPIPAALSLRMRCGAEQISLSHLDREIQYQGALFDRDRTLEHVVWDQEILSHLGPAQWRKLLSVIAQNFTLNHVPSLCASIKASTLDGLKMRELAELPLKQLTVIADGEHTLSNCVEVLQSGLGPQRTRGSMWLAFEFEQPLVRDNPNNFLKAVDYAIALDAGRISLGRFWVTGPLDEEELRVLHDALQRLDDSGYVHLGLEIFARVDHELVMAQKSEKLHFILGEFCGARACDWVPIGPGSVGKLNHAYFQNAVDPDVYGKCIEQGVLPVASGVILSPDDQIRGWIIEQLFCYGCLDIARIERQLGRAFSTYFKRELEVLDLLQTDGLVSVHYPRIQVFPQGKLLVRSICRAFDRYCEANQDQRDRARDIGHDVRGS